MTLAVSIRGSQQKSRGARVTGVRHHSNMSRTSKFLVFAVCMVIAVFVARFIWASSRKTASIPPCINNLKDIYLAKIQWAGDRSGATNDTPTWTDLRPYLANATTNYQYWKDGRLTCPEGGIYTIGRLDELPKCSIGGYDHSYP